MISLESKLQKRSNRHYTRGITSKHVTSGGAYLCACATQFRTPKKKKHRNSGEPLTPIAKSLTTTLSGWKKARLNLNFHLLCAIVRATKKRKVYSKYHKITAKNRFCHKSAMMGELRQTFNTNSQLMN